MKTYTIERRMVKVKTGWFSSKNIPMWCLIEHGTRYEYTNGGNQVYCDSYDYSKVVLQSEDKENVIEELKNFSGETL